MRRFVFVALIVVGVAGNVSAQQPPSSRPFRGYLIGGGGTSIGLAEPSLALSAEVAESIPLSLQVYLSANFYDNVMSDTARDNLTASSVMFTQVSGTPWVFSGRDKARSFTLGVKYVVPTATLVRPYVGGGLGVINIRREITEASRGDMTVAYVNQFGPPDSVVDPAQSNTNHPIGEAAAGVGILLDSVYVDVGYRFRKAYHAGGDGLNLSQVGISLGLRF